MTCHSEPGVLFGGRTIPAAPEPVNADILRSSPKSRTLRGQHGVAGLSPFSLCPSSLLPATRHQREGPPIIPHRNHLWPYPLKPRKKPARPAGSLSTAIMGRLKIACPGFGRSSREAGSLPCPQGREPSGDGFPAQFSDLPAPHGGPHPYRPGTSFLRQE